MIDLRKRVVGMPMAHPIRAVVARTAQFARAFRERGLPVVLVNMTGVAPGRTDMGPRDLSLFPADWAELVPELEQQPGGHLLSKQRVGAFLGTFLDETLRRRGVAQVFLTGITTSMGVESTARSASDLGFNVALVVDAMTDRDAGAHRHSVGEDFPPIG